MKITLENNNKKESCHHFIVLKFRLISTSRLDFKVDLEP